MSDPKNPAENPAAEGGLPGHLRPGNPGNSGGKKGRSGRPANEFKERMQSLANRGKAKVYLQRCIDGEFGPKFHLAAMAFAADRGYGRPNQGIEVTTYDFNPDDFSDEGLDRVAAGEDPMHVLATGGRADRAA